MRGIIDKEKSKSTIKTISFFSPSNKLKINKDQSDKIIKKGVDKKEVYDITKDLGEAYCKAIISNDRLEFLKKYDKQDDLCDSFLQGFFYLFCKTEEIPDKYKKTLQTVAAELEKKREEIKKKKEDKRKKVGITI